MYAMDKIMPLDLLSSIKGAGSSGAVNELFEVIKRAVPDKKGDNAPEEKGEHEADPQMAPAKDADMDHAVFVESLREDTIVRCGDMEKELIKKNFPKQKNGFLVVQKVMED